MALNIDCLQTVQVWKTPLKWPPDSNLPHRGVVVQVADRGEIVVDVSQLDTSPLNAVEGIKSTTYMEKSAFYG